MSRLNFLLVSTIRQVASLYPSAVPLLGAKARYIAARPLAYKTYEFFEKELTRMVKNLYSGFIGGEFIDVLAGLIQGQINQAVEFAWRDAEVNAPMPQYLTDYAEEMILSQFDFVDGFYRDIVDARIDGTPIDPLLARCSLWANRWNEAYDRATSLIVQAMGGKQVWKLGATEQHCETCAALDGIVAYAREWEELGVHPQGAPNELLECGGWRCDCSLEQTDARRSPKAFETIMNIVTK
ncbi:MAG TPA: hypothetical protein PKC99_12680 [Anaerolineales bacterium]|nr:hypothetical protein [Anaerolineales bacterium]